MLVGGAFITAAFRLRRLWRRSISSTHSLLSYPSRQAVCVLLQCFFSRSEGKVMYAEQLVGWLVGGLGVGGGEGVSRCLEGGGGCAGGWGVGEDFEVVGLIV